jgi:hypothetical protein
MKKLIFIAALLWVAGCGYTTRTISETRFKTVAIEHFKNSINFSTEGTKNLYVPLIETKVRNAIIDRFIFDGNLKVKDANQSDLILRGELKSYERTGLRFTDNDDVEEYRVHIIVDLELWDNQTQEVRWSESSFVGEAEYFASGPLAKSEELAINDAIVDLARRVVERTIEDW